MRVSYFLTHPIQNQSPMIRALVRGGVDIEVAYGCRATVQPHFDPGFKRMMAWDVPLLDGYPYVDLGCALGGASFLQKVMHTFQVAGEYLDKKRPDAVWVHGWGSPLKDVPWFPILCLTAARRRGLPVIMRGETHAGCLRGGSLRQFVHGRFLRWLFKGISAFLPVGSANREFYRRLGVPEERIFMMPYAVDNEFFRTRCAAATPQRGAKRRDLGVAVDAVLLLFVGRLAPEKGIRTLIEATGLLVARDDLKVQPHLVIAGDGPEAAQMKILADQLAPDCVTFIGFQNQTELPALYDACDVFVLPSVFEPWGLVVNEVMNAGKPVIVSDRVGAACDLVALGENGWVFPAGDVTALAAALQDACVSGERRVAMGAQSLARINKWDFAADERGLLAALRATLGK
jgi:glycosyltransferase involved in cell wall biosynthesis